MTTHHIDLVIGMGLFVLGVLFFLIGCQSVKSSADQSQPDPRDDRSG